MKFADLKGALSGYFRDRHGLSFVVSPFITNSTLLDVLSGRSEGEVVIVTSWRADHLLTGISSLDLYEICKERGWTLFVNDRVHMKIYSRDLEDCWIGSANMTERGLSDGDLSNHEALEFVDGLSAGEKIRLQRLQSDSTLVTESVFKSYKEWFDDQDLVNIPEDGPDIPMDSEQAFRTSQLPHSETPTRLWEVANGAVGLGRYEEAAMAHDLGVFDVDPSLPLEDFLARMRVVFFSHPFISSFTDDIGPDGMHFGGVKQWIKQNCTDVPVPHAKEITSPTQVLLEWIPALEPGLFEVSRPNHSQVIRRL